MNKKHETNKNQDVVDAQNEVLEYRVSHIAVWSFFKLGTCLSFVFSFGLFIAGFLLWHVSYQLGDMDKLKESIAKSLGKQDLLIDGSKAFLGALAFVLLLAIFGSIISFMIPLVINSVIRLTGGVALHVQPITRELKSNSNVKALRSKKKTIESLTNQTNENESSQVEESFWGVK